MLRLEKPARDPENTVLKAPASENLSNIRVYYGELAQNYSDFPMMSKK